MNLPTSYAQDMSLHIAPRPSTSGGGDDSQQPTSPLTQRNRKISTACGACKQRKTKCSGGQPCEACAARASPCDYDASSDQRRKIANQRNVQDLAQAQHELDRYRQVLGGMIAIIRGGSNTSNGDLMSLVRNGSDISSLAAYVRNEIRASLALQQIFQTIDFAIDGPSDLPSPTQLLNRMEATTSAEEDSSASGFNNDAMSESNHYRP